jgi:hypothetical protein
MKKKHLIITVINGMWYAKLDGKHLTADETAKLIAQGATYTINTLS